jgi:peptide/nickel transport system substrate-binding protein
MKKLLLVLVAAILVIGIALAGCAEEAAPTTPSATTTPTPTTAPTTTAKPTTPTTTTAPTTPTAPTTSKYGGTFRIADAAVPTQAGLGWMAQSPMYWGHPRSYMFFDTLLKCDSQGNIKQCLATDWNIAPDSKSVTLKLRQGVKFHDGSDFNAEVAKWNLDEAIQGKVSSCKDFLSVDKIDDYTIQINVTNYDNTMLNTLACAFMMSKAAYEKNGKDWMLWHPVGTGPFKFVEYELNTAVKGVRFDDYWQEGKPYLDAIEMDSIADPMTRSAAFEAGEVDAVICLTLAKTEHDLQQKGYDIFTGNVNIISLLPDSKNSGSPLANLKVRQALEYAINREAIVNTCTWGFGVPAYQMAAPGAPYYITDLPARTYDPDKAKQLLVEAGYADGFKTKIIAFAGGIPQDVLVAVQGFLSKVGIDVELNIGDVATFMGYMYQGWENGMCAIPLSLHANPNVSLRDLVVQTSIMGVSMLRTAELEDQFLASAAAKEYDPALVQKVIQLIFDEATFLTIYGVPGGTVSQPYVHDAGFNTGQTSSAWEPADLWLSK